MSSCVNTDLEINAAMGVFLLELWVQNFTISHVLKHSFQFISIHWATFKFKFTYKVTLHYIIDRLFMHNTVRQHLFIMVLKNVLIKDQSKYPKQSIELHLNLLIIDIPKSFLKALIDVLYETYTDIIRTINELFKTFFCLP